MSGTIKTDFAAPPVSETTYRRLVGQLFYGTTASFAAQVGASLMLAVITYLRDPLPALILGGFAYTGIAVVRVGIFASFRRLNRSGDIPLEAVIRWERIYAFWAAAWMVAVGVTSYFAMLTHDVILQLFYTTVIFGSSAGMTIRNASRPRIVMVQIVCVLVPYGASLVVIGTPFYLAMLFMVVSLGVSIRSGTYSVYNFVFDSLEASRLNGVIADRFDVALNNMGHGLIMFDRDEVVEVVNDRFLELFEVTPADVRPGVTLRDVIVAASVAARDPMFTVDAYHERFRGHFSERTETQTTLKLRNGRFFDVKFTPRSNLGSVLVVEDVTIRKLDAARIEKLAHYDELTGLPNRAMFRDLLTDAVAAASETGKHFSLLFLDLDQFKEVNDTLGHSVGDRLLVDVAKRVTDSIRSCDVAGRLGGDEFVVLQYADGKPDAHMSLAERLIRRVSKPYEIDGHEVTSIGLSIGVAHSGQGDDAEELLKNADLALYKAKETKGVYVAFERRMNDEALDKRDREIDLRRAIEADEFDVFFQPIMDVKAGKVASFEALVRWFHPTKGMIPPDQFIKLAEQTGMIVDLGALVLRKACCEAAKWSVPVPVAVNLSAVQFRKGVVVEQVVEALRVSGLPGNRLEVEITESLAMGNVLGTRATLAQVKDLGVRVALDDFGTGYTNLAYLRDIAFDKVKIDKSFTDRICDDDVSRSLVSMMATFVSGIGRGIVVEGVETREQTEVLRGLGVDLMQGYLYSKPRPAGDVAAFLAANSGNGGHLRAVA